MHSTHPLHASDAVRSHPMLANAAAIVAGQSRRAVAVVRIAGAGRGRMIAAAAAIAMLAAGMIVCAGRR